jgi:hypothetical protein
MVLRARMAGQSELSTAWSDQAVDTYQLSTARSVPHQAVDGEAAPDGSGPEMDKSRKVR